MQEPPGGFPSRSSHTSPAAGRERPEPKPLPVTTTKPTARAAVAGSYLLGTLLLCAAIGMGLGALVGVPVLMGLVGMFVGVPAGIVVVRRRFEDL